MKRALAIVLLVLSCRPSDGSGKATPGGATSKTVGASATPAVAAPQPPQSRDEALLERADRARIQGDTAARVWLVEISDFECPFCKRWHDETYPAIQREYIKTGRVRMAYVNYPLGQHPHALIAAEAAMCAAAQDRFWPMHDALFNTQNRWNQLTDAAAFYDTLAASISVTMSDWRQCMKEQVTRRLILADRSRGQTAGVSTTPTFFVGSEHIEGALPLEAFRAAIERALAAPRRPSP